MLKLRNVEQKDGLSFPLRHFEFTTPAADVDLVVDNVNLNTATQGEDLAIANKYLPHPMSLFVTKTEAAGADLVVDLRIVGDDQFGNEIEETISLPGGTGTAHGTKVFAVVRRVNLVTLTNEAAGDLLDIGITVSSTSILYGLPFHLQKDSSSGIGGDRDTVKAFFVDGAVTGASENADPTYDAITNVSIAGNKPCHVHSRLNLVTP